MTLSTVYGLLVRVVFHKKLTITCYYDVNEEQSTDRGRKRKESCDWKSLTAPNFQIPDQPEKLYCFYEYCTIQVSSVEGPDPPSLGSISGTDSLLVLKDEKLAVQLELESCKESLDEAFDPVHWPER